MMKKRNHTEFTRWFTNRKRDWNVQKPERQQFAVVLLCHQLKVRGAYRAPRNQVPPAIFGVVVQRESFPCQTQQLVSQTPLCAQLARPVQAKVGVLLQLGRLRTQLGKPPVGKRCTGLSCRLDLLHGSLLYEPTDTAFLCGRFITK